MNDDDEATELDLGNAVPLEVAQTVPKTVHSEELHAFDFEELRGSWVRVSANGYTYEGRLQGADERELYVKSQTKYWVLPLDTVGSVKPLPEPPERKMKRKAAIPGDPDPSMEGAPPLAAQVIDSQSEVDPIEDDEPGDADRTLDDDDDDGAGSAR